MLMVGYSMEGKSTDGKGNGVPKNIFILNLNCKYTPKLAILGEEKLAWLANAWLALCIFGILCLASDHQTTANHIILGKTIRTKA